MSGPMVASSASIEMRSCATDRKPPSMAATTFSESTVSTSTAPATSTASIGRGLARPPPPPRRDAAVGGGDDVLRVDGVDLHSTRDEHGEHRLVAGEHAHIAFGG